MLHITKKCHNEQDTNADVETILYVLGIKRTDIDGRREMKETEVLIGVMKCFGGEDGDCFVHDRVQRIQRELPKTQSFEYKRPF